MNPCLHCFFTTYSWLKLWAYICVNIVFFLYISILYAIFIKQVATVFCCRPAGGSDKWTATACDCLSLYLTGAVATIILQMDSEVTSYKRYVLMISLVFPSIPFVFFLVEKIANYLDFVTNFVAFISKYKRHISFQTTSTIFFAFFFLI